MFRAPWCFPAYDLVVAVPCQSWPGPSLGFGAMVSRFSWQRVLWVQLSANPGWSLLLALVGWSLANPDRRSCGCCSPASLPGACCWFWWAAPSLIMTQGSVGAVCRPFLAEPAAGFGRLVAHHSWRRALCLQFNDNPGWGLLLVSFGLVSRQSWRKAVRVLCPPPILAGGGCRNVFWFALVCFHSFFLGGFDDENVDRLSQSAK